MNTTTSDVSPKFIIAVVAIIAILIGAIWIARPQEGASAVNQSQSATASSALTTVGDPHYDFGTISMAAGKVQRQFTIQNTSAEPVEILKMYTSCMCTEAALSIGGKQFGPYGMPGHAAIPTIGTTINPGEEGVVTVIFDPAAHGPSGVGPIDRVVRIETSSGTMELTFAAMVQP